MVAVSDVRRCLSIHWSSSHSYLEHVENLDANGNVRIRFDFLWYFGDHKDKCVNVNNFS